MSKFHQSTPLLVLACRSTAVEGSIFMNLQDIVEGLQLDNLKRLEIGVLKSFLLKLCFFSVLGEFLKSAVKI